MDDRSEGYTQRAQLLMKNAFQGLVLVFIFLALLLETSLAFWVSLGAPVSFLGSFIFLSASDFSINMISMFAFIVTLGIVVDDAVVVGENVYHQRAMGLSPLKAAIAGVREMAMPVVFSVLTNLVSFLPIYFIPGRMGLEIFPKSDSDYAYCAATLLYGSSQSKLAAVEKELIRSARAVIDKNGKQDLAKGIILSSVSDNVIELRVYLTNMDKRPLSTTQVTDLLRNATPMITGLENIRFESNMGGPGAGKNLTVRLSHVDGKTLDKAGEDLAEALSHFTIVHDIDDGSAQGKRQYD